jgi:hypothetical protein
MYVSANEKVVSLILHRYTTVFRLCKLSLAGTIMPRRSLLEKHEDQTLRHRWPVGSYMLWPVDEFCSRVGVSREQYAAEVATCEADFHEAFPYAGVNGRGGRGRGGRGRRGRGAAPGAAAAIRSAIQARGGVAAGGAAAAAAERRVARRKKREDDVTARNAAKEKGGGGDESSPSS